MIMKNTNISPLFLPLATLILLCWANNHSSQASRNLATIKAIYNLTVFPNNVPFIAQGFSAIPAELFNANATGRVTLLGNFSGFKESAEFFFGLAPVPQAPFYAAFASANAVEPDFGKHLTYLKEIAFWKFGQDGAVLAYDAWIPNLAL
ncbi:hypothetical protein AOQ84DRAFT_226094 [Glonium stellatum]|uniref:Uncharacterized protein n=1 Tax=Glonium stellatum TaxID=574774 RepID=A0A8E2ET28_9PEZI|nr:hypothetical protein AOQ84DRAFT_226094 [Glonium stellatum]